MKSVSFHERDVSVCVWPTASRSFSFLFCIGAELRCRSMPEQEADGLMTGRLLLKDFEHVASDFCSRQPNLSLVKDWLAAASLCFRNFYYAA